MSRSKWECKSETQHCDCAFKYFNPDLKLAPHEPASITHAHSCAETATPHADEPNARVLSRNGRRLFDA